MTKKKTLKSKIPKITNFTNQLTKLLDKTKVKYNLLKHKVVYTAHDLAQTTKRKLSEIAKVVLVKVSGPQPVIANEVKQSKNRLPRSPKRSLAMTNYFALIVLPAGKYLDLSGIKKALKAKKVSLATEKEIKAKLKTKIGLLHPFGNFFNSPPTLSPKGARGLGILLDKTFANSKKLIASAGSYEHSLEIKMKDFEKLANPIKGVFSRNKR